MKNQLVKLGFSVFLAVILLNVSLVQAGEVKVNELQKKSIGTKEVQLGSYCSPKRCFTSITECLAASEGKCKPFAPGKVEGQVSADYQISWCSSSDCYATAERCVSAGSNECKMQRN